MRIIIQFLIILILITVWFSIMKNLNRKERKK